MDCILDPRESEEIRQWIFSNGFRKVGIQLPDNLLKYAVDIVNLIKKDYDKEMFILSDTTLGSHIQCDAIVYFGIPCFFNPYNQIPVFYTFNPYTTLNIKNLIIFLKHQINQITLSDIKHLNIVLTYDLCFYKDIIYKEYKSYIENILAEEFKDLIIKILITHPKLPTKSSNETNDSDFLQIQNNFYYKSTDISINGDKNYNLLIYLGDNDSLAFTQLYFDIKSESRLSNSLKIDRIFTFDNDNIDANPMEITTKMSKLLAKRYHYIEKAKQSKIIGIIVSTLYDARITDTISRVKRLIEMAGKKSYLFVFGKINPYKLGNYGEIDAYVLIACPQSLILDVSTLKTFNKPILTVWELIVACQTDINYSQNFTLDFTKLSIDFGQESDSLEKFEESDSEKQITTRQSMNAALITSSDYLSHLTWQGLEYHTKECDTPAEIVEGRSGNASHYQNEPLITTS